MCSALRRVPMRAWPWVFPYTLRSHHWTSQGSCDNRILERCPSARRLSTMRKQDIQRLLNATLIEEEISKGRAEFERLKAQNDRLEKDVVALRQTEDPPQDVVSIKATPKLPVERAEAQELPRPRVRATFQAFRRCTISMLSPRLENDSTSARW